MNILGFYAALIMIGLVGAVVALSIAIVCIVYFYSKKNNK